MQDPERFDNNYGGAPFPVLLWAGGVIDGWDQGLIGTTAGSQVQLDIPRPSSPTARRRRTPQ